MRKYIQMKMRPRDLIFCRDAKPMEGSYAGYGGWLPSPGTFYGAVMAMLYRKFRAPDSSGLDPRFCSLNTLGPFLTKGDELYFPTPLDITPDGSLLEVKKLEGSSDLPTPLCYGLFAADATKEQVPPWISASELQKYLLGDPSKPSAETELFIREFRPGVTIDSKSQTAEDGGLFFAEYLRLKQDVSFCGGAHLNDPGCMENLLEGEEYLRLGGQGGVVSAEKSKKSLLPEFIKNGIPAESEGKIGKYIKWVLLTPGAWSKGWLPDFVEPSTGKLLLRNGNSEREPGEDRKSWRGRLSKLPELPPDIRLIAARVGKPQAVSGWHQSVEGTEAPRTTHLFVPAGSVYYFETAGAESSKRLIEALRGRALSGYGGSSGCGIGVCGTFELTEK